MQSLHSNISPLFACKGGKNPKSLGKALQKYRGQVSGSTSKNPLERITRPYKLHLKYPCNLQHAPKTQTWRWLWHQEIGLQAFWVSDCCPQCVAVPAVGAVVNSTTSFVGFWGEPRKVTLKYLKKHKETYKRSCRYKIHKESAWKCIKQHTGLFTILYKPCIDKCDTCIYIDICAINTHIYNHTHTYIYIQIFMCL